MWNSASRKQYENFRRIVRLSKCTDASSELAQGYHPSYAGVLTKAGLTSAEAIAALPLATFVHLVESGIPLKDATAIHEKATNTYQSRVITSYEAVQGTGLAAIEGSISTRERLEMVKETGETLKDLGMGRLFGDIERDVCTDCNSFTSPAAYFVEILQFLRSNNLAGTLNFTWQSNVFGTALECLLARRPDLGKLELTCTNTKTVVPYLDLSNEIMESFVVYLWEHRYPDKTKQLPKIKVNCNPSPICGDILPELKEINDKAYSILAESMCPFNKLPYHEPLDEIRNFLLHLKTSRYELVETYRRAFQSGTIVPKDKEGASSLELHATARNRATTAEYLSLTESDYIALTGEDYLKNKYNPLEDTATSLKIQSGVPVRLKAWWEHWGYKKAGEALRADTGPEVIRTEFLRKVGLQSSDLVGLLKTRFVNPHVPREKEIAILESNHFGFISLKKLITHEEGIEDPLVRYKSLIDSMTSQQLRTASISSTGEFSREQVETWVKTNYKIFSKMIVLDNPHMSEGWHSGHARLTHLDGERLNPKELMRIQQFVRLRAKLGWTIDELDKAISALSRLGASETTPNQPLLITTDLLEQLVCVSKLVDMTGLDLEKLLSFWSTISTRGEESLYSQLFINNDHIVADPLFRPDKQGKYFTKSEKFSLHITVIMIAFEITRVELNILLQTELNGQPCLDDQDISIGNLSCVYRHSLMAKVLHITPATLCQVIGIFGDIFKSPSHTFEFLKQWGRLAQAGISFSQLNYIMKGIDDPFNPLGPLKSKILAVIKQLLDGIDVIYTTHPDIKAEEWDAITKEALTAKLSLLYDHRQVSQIHEFLESNIPKWVEKRPPNWLDLTYGFIKDKERDILFANDSSVTRRRFCFLRSFIPYLRHQLVERLAISVLSGEVGISTEMTRILLSGVMVVKTEAGDVSALKAITHLRPRREHKYRTGFEGHLVPSSDNDYTFVNSTPSIPTVQISEISMSFNNPERPSVDQVHLAGGTAYQLRISKETNLDSLQSKINPSPLRPIPDVSLIPLYAEQQITPIFIRLVKIAMLINGCKLSAEEIKYFTSYPHDSPILHQGRLSLGGWRQLLGYLLFRNSLPNTPGEGLIHLFRWASNPEKTEVRPEDKTLSDRISSLLHVQKDIVKKLLAHFGLNQRGFFKDWTRFTRLKKASDLAQRANMDVDNLFTWAEPLRDFQHARQIALSIHDSVRALYTHDDWEKVIKPLRHQLRSNRRDALVGYLLNQPEIVKWGVFNADALFGFFLIDVHVGACLETSRIQQAIATVQTFIRRCLSGQEEKYGVPVRTLDRTRWEWIRSYRTWEANRKIFIYPENSIEPSLRDDKSPVFQALETDLIQGDLDARSIQDAVKKYLSRLDEVANLHVVSVCSDTETKVIHIFARTRGAPYFYYYRTYNPLEGTWGPWEKMQVDIPHYEDHDTNSANHGGAFLKAVVWMGRLIVFIPRFVRYGGKSSDVGSYMGDQILDKALTRSSGHEYWELKVGWTEYQNGKWTPSQVTSKAFQTPSGPGGIGTLRECVFTTTYCNDDLYLSAQVDNRRTAWFRLSKGQFDAVEATDLFTNEYAAATPSINVSKPGLHREFGTLVDKDHICVSTIDPSISNVHPCPNNVHQCLNNVHPCLHITDMPPTTVEYNRRNPTSAVFSGPPDYKTPFYHEFSGRLLRHTSTSNTLDDLYEGFGSEVSKFKLNALGYSGILPGFDMGITYPNYHELRSPYALYNWELGLHIPMLLMDKLRSCHQYEQALKIAHYVFDPMGHHLAEQGNDYCSKDDGGHTEIDYPKRSCVWKWTPFKEISAQNVLGRVLHGLRANPPATPGGHEQVKAARDAPLHPHVIARSRPVAYMKWFVVKYINILLDCGDQYFRVGTPESVSLAIQYYTLAAHLYGPPKQRVQKRGKKHPETYESLVKMLNIADDPSANCKTTFPFSHPTAAIHTTAISTVSGILDGDVSLYFVVPENEKHRDLRIKIDDRLYRIQRCQDLRGMTTCKFDFLQPKVDATALVHAASQGLSLYSILRGLNAPMPNCRFRYILEKAFEIVRELKLLGNAFLTAMVNKDTETYHLIRAGHENSINAMILGMKRLSLEEANKALASLRDARKGPMSRLEHLYQLIGENQKKSPLEEEEFKPIIGPVVRPEDNSCYRLTAFEKAEISKAGEVTEFIEKRNATETSSSILISHPTMSTSAMHMPVGIGFGSQKLGQGASAFARAMAAQMELLQSQSIGAARKSSLLRQYQDRIQEANFAGHEIKHIDGQIETQKIRIELTNRDIELQQKRLELATDTEQFLRAKYTNQDLYIWQEKRLRELYHQTYTLAYDLAKKAENSFQFERGPVNSFHFENRPSIANFIQPTWNVNRDGLFSGEELYLGLKRLETAYNENRGYDYEITKHISLRQLNPRALLELRELGNCEFDLPEILFDLDFPGHYKRRIKAVSLTITPPVRAPTSVNCTMRLIRHSYRTKVALNRESYARGWTSEDDSFHTDVVPIDSIVTSHGRTDSGTFDLVNDSTDERYLPFEGAGVISRWRLELPPHYRSFDYRSIVDAMVHIRYTSVYGGDTLKGIANENLDWYLGNRGLLCLSDPKQDCSDAWKAFRGSFTITLPNLLDTLAFSFNRYSNQLLVKEIFIFTTSNVDAARWKMVVPFGATTKEITFQASTARGMRCFVSAKNIDCGFGNWVITMTKTDKAEVLRDLYVVANFTVIRK